VPHPPPARADSTASVGSHPVILAAAAPSHKPVCSAGLVNRELRGSCAFEESVRGTLNLLRYSYKRNWITGSVRPARRFAR
jgi:hypothetical protein